MLYQNQWLCCSLTCTRQPLAGPVWSFIPKFLCPWFRYPLWYPLSSNTYFRDRAYVRQAVHPVVHAYTGHVCTTSPYFRVYLAYYYILHTKSLYRDLSFAMLYVRYWLPILPYAYAVTRTLGQLYICSFRSAKKKLCIDSIASSASACLSTSCMISLYHM